MSGVKYRFQRICKFYAVASQIATYVYFNLAVKCLRVSFGRHAKLPRVFLLNCGGLLYPMSKTAYDTVLSPFYKIFSLKLSL